jgi:homoserine O-acetyltransferase
MLVSLMLLSVMSCAALAQTSADTNRRPAQPHSPAPTQGDFLIRDFHFRSGEVLPELKLHYTTRPGKNS